MSKAVEKGVTYEQFLQNAKSLRKTCQPKHKVSDELADQLGKKNFPEDKNLKCYVKCFLEMAQTMKRGKINVEAAIRQIDILVPEHLRNDYKATVQACKDSFKGIKDNCEASYIFLKCSAEQNPSYEFP
uniref:Odorant binding protein n=1 Tax=Phlebotomus papatasi TaxID=29031 RepID=A0A1B0DGX3_PHLPP